MTTRILLCSAAVIALANAAETAVPRAEFGATAAKQININKLIDEPAPDSTVRNNIDHIDLRTDYAEALAGKPAAAKEKIQEAAGAKGPIGSEKPRNEKPVMANRFEKGTRRVGAFGGMAQAFDDDETIYYGGVAGEYFIIDDLSLRGELVAYSVDQRNSEDTLGGGFNALARWYALKSKDRRMAMFLEGGGGLAQFNGRTPGPEGTDFEFTLHAGFGGDFKITNCISLIAAPRYLHVSNAFIHGRSRHGTIDSVGGYAGFSIKF